MVDVSGGGLKSASYNDAIGYTANGLRETGRVVKRGRPPKGAANNLRSEILETAEKLFLADGYAATSVERIASQMRSSKRTIYDLFPTKLDLLLAVFEHVISCALRDVRDITPKTGPFAAQLRAVGESLLVLAVSPENVAVYRLLTSEAYRFPGISDAVQREIVDPMVHRVEIVFEHAASQGEIVANDLPSAARQFVEFVWSQELRRMMIGLDEPGITADRLARLDGAVELFAKAYSGDRCLKAVIE